MWVFGTGAAVCFGVLSVVVVRLLDDARSDWERNAFELGRDYERSATA